MSSHALHVSPAPTRGLSSSQFAEILEWARYQPFQILALQETRWQGSREWADDTWYFVAVGGHSTSINWCVGRHTEDLL